MDITDLCRKPNIDNLPTEIIKFDCIKMISNHKYVEIAYFVGDNGIAYHAGEYSVFLGFQPAALGNRVREYGKDAPGILKKRFRASEGRVSADRCAPGNNAWAALSGKPRNLNTDKIKVGTFEQSIPCPPAAEGGWLEPSEESRKRYKYKMRKKLREDHYYECQRMSRKLREFNKSVGP